MTTDEILLDVEERMEKAIRKLKGDLAGIRTGRANPGLVDSLRVEVYGSAVPIKQMASVGAPEPNQIVIRPYDPGTIKDIEKAIQTSDLGFNPQSDGRVIRLNVPPLSTEVRRKMVGRVKELAEEAEGGHPQHPPRRQQDGRPGREGQGLLRRRPRPASRKKSRSSPRPTKPRPPIWPRRGKKRSWKSSVRRSRRSLRRDRTATMRHRGRDQACG